MEWVVKLTFRQVFVFSLVGLVVILGGLYQFVSSNSRATK